MALARYLDFDLLIEPHVAGVRAYVLDSPAGQAQHVFAAAALGALPAPDADPLRSGAALFATVFADDVALCLRRSLDAARAQDAGLRLRLRIADDPALRNLPWECLYDADRAQFLALSARTPVTRYIELPDPATPLAVAPPLRMLVALAGPRDYPPLDAEREWAQINAALAEPIRRGSLVIERLDVSTVAALQDRLRTADYQIIHFIGHGELAAGAAEGALIFGSPSDNGVVVPGSFLAALLRDETRLRLLVLNACAGARVAEGAFSGVAQRCVQGGLPAVIAMQAPIGDAAAVVLARTLYASLADALPVDAALAEARKALYTAGETFDWAVPVLFMRAADGILWTASHQEPPMSDMPEQPWWERLPPEVGGDVIIANVGAGASGVAVGKGITQQLGNLLGPPQPSDHEVIEAQLGKVLAALQSDSRVDPAVAGMAKFQLELLKGELTKTGADEVPSANTLTQVGDWLLDNVPAIAEALTSLFATPAVGKLIGKAGERAVAWARRRFGGTSPAARS